MEFPKWKDPSSSYNEGTDLTWLAWATLCVSSRLGARIQDCWLWLCCPFLWLQAGLWAGVFLFCRMVWIVCAFSFLSGSLRCRSTHSPAVIPMHASIRGLWLQTWICSSALWHELFSFGAWPRRSVSSVLLQNFIIQIALFWFFTELSLIYFIYSKPFKCHPFLGWVSLVELGNLPTYQHISGFVKVQPGRGWSADNNWVK